MESTAGSKPHVTFEFEVEKILGISADGRYQVQWAPEWVSKFHLVGCEHLIQEFLHEQAEISTKGNPENQVAFPINQSFNIVEGRTPSLMDYHSEMIHQTEHQFECNRENRDDTDVAGAPLLSILMNQVKGETDDEFEDSGTQIRYDDFVNSLELEKAPDQDEHPILGTSISPVEVKEEIFEHTVFPADRSVDKLISNPNKNGSSVGEIFEFESDTTTKTSTTKRTSTHQSNKHQKHPKTCPNRTLVKCPHCTLKFSSSALKNHIRVHTDERPYSCDFCEFKCKQIGNLNVHMRTHKGEKPFTCTFCGKTFSRRNRCKGHAKHCSRKIKEIQIISTNDLDDT